MRDKITFGSLPAAEQAALKFLDAQVRGLNAYEIGNDHIDAVSRLARRRIGRSKIVDSRTGRQGFTEWRLTDAGRDFVRGRLFIGLLRQRLAVLVHDDSAIGVACGASHRGSPDILLPWARLSTRDKGFWRHMASNLLGWTPPVDAPPVATMPVAGDVRTMRTTSARCSSPPSSRGRRAMSDAPAIIAALAGAITTASNDDTSAPSTEQRSRHVERIGAMGDAAEFIAAQDARLAAALAALSERTSERDNAVRTAQEMAQDVVRLSAALDEAREALATLIGTLEIASVMPESIKKVYVPRLDATELVAARAALARIDALKGETDA